MPLMHQTEELKMKKRILLILMLIISLLLAGCVIKPSPDDNTDEPEIPEPYSEENAKLAAAFINSSFKDTASQIVHILDEPSLGERDFTVSVGNGDFDAVYADKTLYTSALGYFALVNFKNGAFTYSEKNDAEWSLSTIEALKNRLEITDLISAVDSLELERVIYTELTFGEDSYYHVDKGLIYTSIYNTALSSYNKQFPNASSTVLSAYKLTLQRLLQNIDYDIALMVKKDAVSSVKLTFSLNEKFCELTENENLKSMKITAVSDIPAENREIENFEIELAALLTDGTNASLELSFSSDKTENKREVDLSMSLKSAPLAEAASDSGAVVKAIGDITVSGSLAIISSEGALASCELALKSSLDNDMYVSYNAKGEIISDTPDSLLTPIQISELRAKARDNKNIEISARLTMPDSATEAGEISIAVSAEQSRLTYLGDIEFKTAVPENDFEAYKKSAEGADTLIACAKGIMKDLRTKRSDKYYAYLDKETDLYITVHGEDFVLSSNAPEYEYISVAFNGTKFEAQ